MKNSKSEGGERNRAAADAVWQPKNVSKAIFLHKDNLTLKDPNFLTHHTINDLCNFFEKQ